MYLGQDYDPIEPGETDIFTIEFSEELAPGITISAPVWTCAVASTLTGFTADPTPANRLAGLANVTAYGGRTFTNQAFTGMIAGNNYILQATVTTSDGRTLQRYSHVLCIAAN